MMKRTFGYLVIAISALLFQACGGGGGNLLNEDADLDPLVPDPVVDDGSDRPRPSEGAQVITTTRADIVDVSGKPVLLRGINLQYGDNPLARIGGITPIKEVGANVVRLQLRENTTADELEGALNRIVEQGMIAMVMLWEEEGKITCTEDDTFLFQAMQELWLGEWLPVLVQDRFQPHLMINIANEWGPMNIFNANSTGYQDYIDTYKVLIRTFRDAGFKVPLVIDAAHCGQDYNAFLGGRGRELLAADDEENLVLSVHGYGTRWNANEKIATAMTQLSEEGVPVIMGEFGGSGVGGDSAVDHLQIMRKGAGDRALVFDLPWTMETDKAAYSMPLEQPTDLSNSSVSVDVFFGRKYVEDGKLGIVMYLKDAAGGYANLGWNQANALRGNAWNTLKYQISGIESIGGFVSEEFDLSAVTQIGFEIIANGKPADVVGDIKFDNLLIGAGGGSEPFYEATFETDNQNWVVVDGGPVVVGQADGALTLTPTDAAPLSYMLEMQGINALSPAIDFSKPVTINARVWLPAEYADESGLFFKFYGQFLDWAWAQTADAQLAAFTPDGWADLSFTVNFSDQADVSAVQRFGIQIGGINGAKTQPILIDSITIIDPDQATPTASQFLAGFESGTDGFSVNTGDSAEAEVTQVDGALQINTAWVGKTYVTIENANMSGVQTIDLSGPVTLKADVMVPADYAGSGLWFKFFLKDGEAWNWYATSPDFTVADFAPGDWATLEFVVESFPAEFVNTVRPNAFGFQIGGVATAGTIMVDNLEIIGAVQEAPTEVLVDFDFSDQAEADAFIFDYAEGSFSESALSEAKAWGFGLQPFGWIAWSWIGNGEADQALDMSYSEDAVDLTPRGDEIVNGEAGIAETSETVAFE